MDNEPYIRASPGEKSPQNDGRRSLSNICFNTLRNRILRGDARSGMENALNFDDVYDQTKLHLTAFAAATAELPWPASDLRLDFDLLVLQPAGRGPTV